MIFYCPKCNQKIECDDQYQGQTVQCPSCNAPIQIPFIAAQHVTHAVTAQETQKKKNDEEQHIRSGYPCWLYFSGEIILGILLSLVGIGILLIIMAIWKRYSQKWELTTKKLKVINGVIIKDETTVRLQDIRAISMKRNLFDVIFSTGSILVGTAATANNEITIRHIKDAKYLQTQLNELRDAID